MDTEEKKLQDTLKAIDEEIDTQEKDVPPVELLDEGAERVEDIKEGEEGKYGILEGTDTDSNKTKEKSNTTIT